MNDQPFVTIVTPCLNAVKYLEETIVSVIEQDYPNIEYIIMDAGSTDGTVEIIRKYADQIAYWESKPDRGQSHAINKGWQRGKGEILAYINADDRYAGKTVVREAVEYFLQHPEVMMVHGQADLENETGVVLKQHLHKLDIVKSLCHLPGKGMIQPSVFYARSAVESAGWLDESLHYKMDGDIELRIAARFPVGFVPRIWARVILRQDMKSNDPKAHMEILTFVRKFFLLKDLSPDILKVRRQAFALAYLRNALGLTLMGRKWASRFSVLHAMLLYPAIILSQRSMIATGFRGKVI